MSGVLVADVGQRVLEAGQALATPPAEQLLQSVRDEDGTEADPKNQQAKVLGAATVGGANRLVVVMLVLIDPVGRENRVLTGGLGLIRQRLLPAADHARFRCWTSGHCRSQTES